MKNKKHQEGLKLALAGIAPTEKTEHFIYAILPITLGLWFATILSLDLIASLAAIGIFSSILTILLYEARLDYRLVVKWYSRSWGKDQQDIEKSFVSWDLFFKNWYKTNADPPQYWGVHNDIELRVDSVTTSVVKSYAISKRLWSIRGSMYLFVALPFLTNTAVLNITRFLGSFTLPLFGIIAATDYSGQLMLTLVLSIIFMTFHYLQNVSRHSNLRDDIYNLSIFRYAQNLLAFDTLVSPDKYGKGGIPLFNNLQDELDALQEIVNADDWVTFSNRWVLLRSHKELDARNAFHNVLIDELLQTWGNHCPNDCDSRKSSYAIRRCAKKLGWTLHFIREFLRTTNRYIEDCLEDIIDLGWRLYESDYAWFEFTSEGWNPAGFPMALDRSSKQGTGRRLTKEKRSFPRLTNPLLVFLGSTKGILTNSDQECMEYTRKFKRFLGRYILDFFAVKVTKDNIDLLESELEKVENWKSKDFGQLIVRLTALCTSNESITELWSDLSEDEQLGSVGEFLHIINPSVGDEDWQSFLESLVDEGSDNIEKRLLENQDITPYLKLLDSSKVST